MMIKYSLHLRGADNRKIFYALKNYMRGRRIICIINYELNIEVDHRVHAAKVFRLTAVLSVCILEHVFHLYSVRFGGVMVGHDRFKCICRAAQMLLDQAVRNSLIRMYVVVGTM